MLNVHGVMRPCPIAPACHLVRREWLPSRCIGQGQSVIPKKDKKERRWDTQYEILRLGGELYGVLGLAGYGGNNDSARNLAVMRSA